MKVYVASSWRNPYQPAVVERLRAEGHEVYDFRNPAPGCTGFSWREIDPEWQQWSPAAYRANLSHPTAERGYRADYEAMLWADAIVGVMPFGRSASMEMGWGAGQGKPTFLLLADGEPDLMVKMFDHLCCSLDELVAALAETRIVPPPPPPPPPHLSAAEIERLALLVEESGEMLHVIGKTMRHGYDSHHPSDSTSNRRWLEEEIGNVVAATQVMQSSGDIDHRRIHGCALRKLARVVEWLLHHNKVVVTEEGGVLVSSHD